MALLQIALTFHSTAQCPIIHMFVVCPLLGA